MLTTANPELAALLRGLCLCQEDQVEVNILVFADWLEEHCDERAGMLRALIHDCKDEVVSIRSLLLDGDDRIDVLHDRAKKHGCTLNSWEDAKSRSIRYFFDVREAALKRFGVMRFLSGWGVLIPERDAISKPNLLGTLLCIFIRPAVTEAF